MNERELAAVDAAARLDGLPRAHFVRAATLAAARQRIAAELPEQPHEATTQEATA